MKIAKKFWSTLLCIASIVTGANLSCKIPADAKLVLSNKTGEDITVNNLSCPEATGLCNQTIKAGNSHYWTKDGWHCNDKTYYTAANKNDAEISCVEQNKVTYLVSMSQPAKKPEKKLIINNKGANDATVSGITCPTGLCNQTIKAGRSHYWMDDGWHCTSNTYISNNATDVFCIDNGTSMQLQNGSTIN